jgi:hypothetical protein
VTELIPLIQSSFERAPWGWALLGTVILALVKTWPIMSLQVQQAREKLRAENRTDLSDCQKQIKEMRGEMGNLHRQFHELELKLVGAIQGFRILEAEVTALRPDALSLVQARAALSAAFTIASHEDEMAKGKSSTLKAAEQAAESAEISANAAENVVSQVRRNEEDSQT